MISSTKRWGRGMRVRLKQLEEGVEVRVRVRVG